MSHIQHSLENKHQNLLYRSQHPNQTQTIIDKGQESCMRLSLISLQNDCKSELDKSYCKGKRFSYQYKRIDNMFKIVSIENNKMQENERPSKLEELQKRVGDLVERVGHLENRQEHRKERVQVLVQALHQEIAWLAQRDREVQLILSQQGQEISQIKQRLQEIEEQSSSTFLNFQNFKDIQNETTESINCQFQQKIKQELQATISQIACQFDSKIKQIESQIRKLPDYQLQQRTKSVIKKSEERVSKNQISFLKRIESYELMQSSKQYFAQEKIYRVDQNGVLLDEDGYRLVGQDNQQIKLQHKHLQILKKFSILSPHKISQFQIHP